MKNEHNSKMQMKMEPKNEEEVQVSFYPKNKKEESSTTDSGGFTLF